MISKVFLHSTQKRLPDGEVIIVRESEIDTDTNIITPKLKFYKNPKRNFWITKPEFRNHKFKKERCKISELDEYTVYNYELIDKLKEALGEYKQRPTLDYLCRGPFVYGADINIEALIKMSYINKYGFDHLSLSTGFLDIETSVVEDSNKEIILITVTHETKVYTAIRKAWMFEDDVNGNRKPFTIEDVIVESKTQLHEFIKKHGFTFEYYVGDSEIDLIKWIMEQIFKNKTDFIGIWNINFDIPVILNAIKKARYNPLDIMCHPEVPGPYRKLTYRVDESRVSHWTLKWHWLAIPGYTQFIDSMGLYSQIRKTTKFEDSYTLEAILQSNLGIGKIKIPEADSHFLMQTKFFKKYIVYNQFDSIGIQLLEWKNEDILSMMVFAGETPVSSFGYKTVTTTNKFYNSQKQEGYIISSRSNEDPLKLIA